ncbi:MAG: ABC transporter ATP-binding protein [Elusimicrobiota bacterium]
MNKTDFAEQAIILDNIKKSFFQGKKESVVLDGLSLKFKRGQWHTIYGVSGSGKTTLLNTIGGIESPDSGFLYFGDVSIYDLPDRKISRWRNRCVGFVFQFFHLISELNVKQNILLPCRIGNIVPDYDWLNRIAEVLSIESLLNRIPLTLSGGEMQRVALARALINKPSFILADEPTGNLDSENTASIIELLKYLKNESGVGIILATHERELIDSGDEKLEISDGKIINS